MFASQLGVSGDRHAQRLGLEFNSKLDFKRQNDTWGQDTWGQANLKRQVSKTMLKNEFCKLMVGICLRAQGKLPRDFIMNTRGTILRICLIQSHISGRFRLRDIRKTCVLKNKNHHYFRC